MTLGEYYQLLEKHDWLYDYSDDHSVWTRGTGERQNLMWIAQQNGQEFQNLFYSYYNYVFSGPHFNKPPQSKPQNPDYQPSRWEKINGISKG